MKVIAEAGVNHNGSLDTAKELVRVAADSGADIIKFQTFDSSSLASISAELAEYQIANKVTDNNQVEMLKNLELKHEYHWQLLECCNSYGIEFLSTPFDSISLKFLAESLKLNTLKIPSGEITNGPLLYDAAQYGKDVILSTGMSNIEEIERALTVMAYGYANIEAVPSPLEPVGDLKSVAGYEHLIEKVTLLQCTTAYPTPYDQINLKAINTLNRQFGLRTGISDHSIGIEVPIAAVAMGAVLVEKHITLDRNMPGPDHIASLEPDELAEMINSIRNIEDSIGDGIKVATSGEFHNMNTIRKSLVAAKPIKAGENFSRHNLTAKRPGTGLSPMHYWSLLGREATRDYLQDELI